MTRALHTLIEQALAAVASKDIVAALQYFADDAVLIDPHYPTSPMAGKQAIADGFHWAFTSLDQLNFHIVNMFAAEDGHGAAVEVATTHVVRGGRKIQFTQTFVLEIRDGRITRLQAYTPYGPGGLTGIFLSLLRVRKRLTSKH